MVPTSNPHHLHVAVGRTSPLLACHCWPHGAHERCPSPACHRWPHITIAHTSAIFGPRPGSEQSLSTVFSTSELNPSCRHSAAYLISRFRVFLLVINSTEGEREVWGQTVSWDVTSLNDLLLGSLLWPNPKRQDASASGMF